jgi:hypothetical protein
MNVDPEWFRLAMMFVAGALFGWAMRGIYGPPTS